MGVLLEAQSLSRRFGGVAATNDVSFDVRQGEILGLIGPNGAGKTTIMNLISGTLSLSGGKLLFEGRDVSKLPPYERVRLGIARTFQTMEPLYGLSVRENVCAAAIFGRENRSVPEGLKMADAMLERMGLAHKRTVIVDNLNLEEKKRLEMARALALNPKLLLLDEILAGLTPDQAQEITAMVREINKQGVTIIFIEHVMRVVMNLCDRIMVLHFGQKIACDTPEEIGRNPAVIKAYLGSEFKGARQVATS